MALVCHCFGVRDHGVRAAALTAGGDLSAVQDSCQAGTACGGCLPEVEALCSSVAEAIAPAASAA